jgi:2-dehydro-3-deoxyphosphogluconate aldolase/(4S)-4-hydroxy-2-oxoglutarate aldolase
MKKVIEEIKQHKIISVLRADSSEEAINKGNALIRGGMRILELTLTIPEASSVIRYFANKQTVLVGAGTVLSKEEAEQAHHAGAKFILSPGWSDDVASYAEENELLYIPGIFTPTDLMNALKENIKIVKLFPASALGPEYMKSLKGPFPQAEFIPTGGIIADNFGQWLDHGALAVGLGGSLTNGSLSEIEDLANQIVSKRMQLWK